MVHNSFIYLFIYFNGSEFKSLKKSFKFKIREGGYTWEDERIDNVHMLDVCGR